MSLDFLGLHGTDLADMADLDLGVNSGFRDPRQVDESFTDCICSQVRSIVSRLSPMARLTAMALPSTPRRRDRSASQCGTIRLSPNCATSWAMAEVNTRAEPAGEASASAPIVQESHVRFAATARCRKGELALVAATGLRCVLVTGEAGMGKTMLLGEFARSAEKIGVTVLYAPDLRQARQPRTDQVLDIDKVQPARGKPSPAVGRAAADAAIDHFQLHRPLLSDTRYDSEAPSTYDTHLPG